MRLLQTVLIAAAGIVAATTTASAAPQAMMLVASGDSVPFHCTGDLCLAEATSLCLQFDRAAPRPGTPYEVLDERRYATDRPNGLHLVGIAPSGTEKPLPTDVMQLVSEREHMVVRFTVPKSFLQDNAVDRLELRFTENVVVAPVWTPGDPRPQMEEDLELAMGPLRAIAESVLNQQQDSVRSVQLLGGLLNALPRDRVASLDERRQLYRTVLAARNRRAGKPLTKDALAGAQAALDACGVIRDQEMWLQRLNTRVSRYRACIGYRHDRLIKQVNKAYWDAAQAPGS